MFCVFQNIDPPLHPANVSSPRTKGGGVHSPGGEGGGGSIFWKTQDIGLASYSNNLSTVPSIFRGIFSEQNSVSNPSGGAIYSFLKLQVQVVGLLRI